MNQKGFTPILVLILIIAAIGVYFQYSKVKQTPSPTATDIPKGSPITSTQPSPKSNIVKKTIQSTPTPKSTQTVYVTNLSSVKLNSINPNIANSGQEIIILGTGFGTITGKVNLYNQIMGPNTIFAGVAPNRWTDNEIKITVPSMVGGQTINVEIVHLDGTKSNRMSFLIAGGQPRIDIFSPNNAQPLQEISVYGTGFGTITGSVNIFSSNTVDYNTPFTKCEVTNWSETSIRCKLPSTVNNGTEYGFEIMSSDNRKSSLKYYKVGN